MFDRPLTFSSNARLWLNAPPSKQMSLQFTSDDQLEVAYVRAYLREHLPNFVQAFHQIDGGSYQLFECWSKDQDAIFRTAFQVSRALGLDLSLMTPERDLLDHNASVLPQTFPKDYDLSLGYAQRFGE